MQIHYLTLYPILLRGNIRLAGSKRSDNEQQYYQQLAQNEYKDKLKIDNLKLNLERLEV